MIAQSVEKKAGAVSGRYCCLSCPWVGDRVWVATRWGSEHGHKGGRTPLDLFSGFATNGRRL